MFFKSDQANVSDARDAVKKQLLRTLIQQVVDELNNESGEGFDEAITEFLSDAQLSAATGSIKDVLSESIRRQLFPELVKEVMKEIAPDTDDLDELVARHLDDVDFSLVREQLRLGFKRQLQEKIIPASILDAVDEASVDGSGELASMVSNAMEEVDVTNLSATVRGEVQRLVHQLLPDVVTSEVEQATATESDELNQRISDAVAAADADAMIGRLREMAAHAFEARLDREVREELLEPKKVLHKQLEEMVAERFEKFLMSSEWADGIRAAEEQVITQVRNAVEETVSEDALLQEQLNDAIEQRIAQNDGLRSKLEQNAREALVASLSEQMSANLSESTRLVEETAQAITSKDVVMNELQPKLEERVLALVAEWTVENLSDADQAAERSMTHVDENHEHLSNAIESLSASLIEEIADRAVHAMSDVDEVKQKAQAWISADHQTIRDAVDEVIEHVVSLVRTQAKEEAADTPTVVSHVMPSFTAETDAVKGAVRETRNRLVERVAQLTTREMEDAPRVAAEANKRIADENERVLDAVQATLAQLTERVAEGALDKLNASEQVASEASSRVPTDNEVFQRAIKATMSLLIDDIVIEVGSRMRSAEKVSTDARERMADTPAEVRQAAGVLENMLLQQVAEMAKERLYDVQHASEKASTFLRATKELDAIEEAMRMKLFKGLADQVVKSIEDPETAGAEAFWHVDQQHEHILDAMSELRNQLLFTIAKETMGELSDSESAARESRNLIPATSRQITEATARLRSMLVEEVARESLNLMRDTDEVIREAGGAIDDDHEVVQRMRSIVERHLMENLLDSALSDIGQTFNGMDEPAERAYFRQAVRGIQEARTAGEAPASPTHVSAPRFDLPSSPSTDSSQPEASTSADVMNHEQAASPEMDALGEVEIDVSISEPDTDVQSQDEGEQDRTTEDAADQSDWSSLSDLSGSDASRRAWKVNEFRPMDRDAIPGAISGDGARSRAPKLPKRASTPTTLYVFGIVRTEMADTDAFAGIEGIVDNAEIKLLSCGPLTALVSPVTDAALAPDTIHDSMADTEWLKGHVRRHADVLAEAQGVQTVIPMRFGCVFRNPSEVKAFVDERHAKLEEALDRLHNRSEFSVRVRFDGQESDTDLDGVPAGVADFLRQAADDVEHAPRPDGIADRIHTHLTRFSVEAMRNVISDDEMMLNATYLIAVASEESFREEVQKLSSEFHALGIRIEVSGPWPPYHFVDIDFGSGENGATMEA